MEKIGTRVVAIESFKNGVLKLFGEGIYVGNKIPDTPPFNEIKLRNPCIKLDSGKYVWGMECWWGEKEKFYEKYGEHIKETIDVSDNLSNTQPMEEEEKKDE